MCGPPGAGVPATIVGAGTIVGTQGDDVIVGSSGPDELAYVPPDSRLVAFANVRDVMDSDLRHKLQAFQPDSAGRIHDFE